jgi:hypothetical protein
MACLVCLSGLKLKLGVFHRSPLPLYLATVGQAHSGRVRVADQPAGNSVLTPPGLPAPRTLAVTP